MKRICLLLVLLMVPFAFAEEQDSSQLDAMKAGLQAAGNEFLLKLDAAIKVSSEKGIAVGSLNKLREEFSSLLAKADEQTTIDGLKQLQKDMQELAEKVREAAKRENLVSYSKDVKKAIDDAAKERKEEFSKLKATAAEARKKAVLRQYENHLEQANKRIAKMKELGLNVLELEAKLKDFEAVKVDLEKAFGSADKIDIKNAMHKMKTAWSVLQKAFEAVEKQRAALDSMKKANALVDKMQKRTDELRKKGKDTSELEKSMVEFKHRVTDAQQAIDIKNYGGVKNSLKEARNVFEGVKKEYAVAQREKIIERAEKKLEKAGEKLERAKEDIAKRAEKLGKVEEKIEATKEKLQEAKEKLEERKKNFENKGESQ